MLSAVFETPAVVAACIVLARRFVLAPGGRAWVIYSVATILVVVALQVLAALAYLSNDPGSLFGFLQRLQFFTLQGWIAVLAWRLLTVQPLTRNRGQEVRGIAHDVSGTFVQDS